ncbi:MAG: hypothetical protein HC828_17865, partial [Blastochloris sp.]|nr:hypothetical protein [Blastochloris sp.]
LLKRRRRLPRPPKRRRRLAASEATAASATELSGELVVYSTRAEALFNVVLEAFNKQYPNITITGCARQQRRTWRPSYWKSKTVLRLISFVNSDTLTME